MRLPRGLRQVVMALSIVSLMVFTPSSRQSTEPGRNVQSDADGDGVHGGPRGRRLAHGMHVVHGAALNRHAADAWARGMHGAESSIHSPGTGAKLESRSTESHHDQHDAGPAPKAADESNHGGPGVAVFKETTEAAETIKPKTPLDAAAAHMALLSVHENMKKQLRANEQRHLLSLGQVQEPWKVPLQAQIRARFDALQARRHAAAVSMHAHAAHGRMMPVAAPHRWAPPVRGGSSAILVAMQERRPATVRNPLSPLKDLGAKPVDISNPADNFRAMLEQPNKETGGRHRHKDMAIESECTLQPVSEEEWSARSKIIDSPPSVPRLAKLAVVGIARNIGRAKIRHAMQEITRFGEAVFEGRFSVFFVENDSNDCTGSALKEWEKIDPQRVHISSRRLGAAAPRLGNHRERIRRLAQYRNEALEMMRTSNEAPFDFVVAIDLDMKPTWTAETLARPLQRGQCSDNGCKWNFDMACANGVMSEHDDRFYDAFALRSEKFPSGPLDVSPYFGRNGYVVKVMQGLRRDETAPPVPVDSCFSGAAIYRGEMFQGCNYTSPDGDCEHVHIHRCMRRAHPSAAFWMLPAMKLIYDLDDNELRGYDVEA